MVLLHQRIAIRRLDTPERQQGAALDTKILSIRANSAPYFCSATLPAASRQSETRRLIYCQSCSLNSGCLRIFWKTLMSGSMRARQRM
jgi:hypothetical protein